MFENRKAYESNLEAQLAQWKADLDVIQAKARRAEVGAMVQYDQTLDSLQRKHEEAGVRLHDLKVASDEAWEEMKISTEKVWTEVKTLFNTSSSRP